MSLPPDDWSALDEKGLPANLQAERMVLGAIQLDGSRFAVVDGVVGAADFAADKHRKIYRRMADLHQRGIPIDRVTLAEELMRFGELESVGGMSYLVTLDDGLPELLNLETYAGIVAEKSARRRAILAGQTLMARAAGNEDLDRIMEDVRTVLRGVEPQGADEFATPGEVVVAAGGLDTYLAQFRARGMSWPWPHLTQITAGIFPGELIIIAAGTGRGKSDFALNTAYHCACEGKGVAIFSLEMSREQVVNRLAALAGGFNRSIIRHEPNLWQVSTMAAGFGAVADMPIFIRDSSALTMAAIEAGVRRLLVRHDIRLVIVDYLQLVTGTGRTRAEQVGSVARGLKVMASSLKVSVLAACQFSRDHQKSGVKPQLHDLRESGDIEQAANVVLMLHGDTKYTSVPSEQLPIDLIVAKQRDGVSRFEVPMIFRGDTGRFSGVT